MKLLYYLEFILTTKCNQQCDYCNVYNMNSSKTKLEVDIDFLKYILRYIPNNTKIEFCGGEPGLLTNLDEAFNIVTSNEKVKEIQVMSNGLVRLNNYDWLENSNVTYYEHLIKDITGVNIEKFYNELEFIKKPRWKYVIVTTYKTITSLLENLEYFDSINLFGDMFWYKMMNPKTKGIYNFIPELEKFYEYLINKNSSKNDKSTLLEKIYNKAVLERLNNINNSKTNDTIKNFCSLNSPLPTINFETKEIVHCGAVLGVCKRYKFTKNNFLEHLKCNLFTNYNQYCKDCYIFENQTPQSILSCRKGKFYNRSLKEVDHEN